MTNGEYFVLTHPDVKVEENGTCVWIYNLDKTACNHYTMSMEWWNEEMATVYEFKGCDNCELDRPKGKWIFSGVEHTSDNPIDSDSYYCSVCKRSISTTLTRPTDLFPFCHCGADMRGDV